jgi:glucosyl-dolichyl phosphate glucuronosyltransferase
MAAQLRPAGVTQPSGTLPCSPVPLSYSVIICAGRPDRWDLLKQAVQSARRQTVAPAQIVVCVDHNPELFKLASYEWESEPPVRVIENRFDGRQGSARNSAVEVATAEIVAFLDDDARAEPDWLSRLDSTYASAPEVQAVGGGPRPRYEVQRPQWFPFEFDWVFGCAYRGLPTERARTGRLIGASMSARRAAVLKVGGFHSDEHDDMDLSHRVIATYGPDSVVYDPAIQVSHFVTRERLSWSYFWRRCFYVNRSKVFAFNDMAEAGNLSADLAFARHAILRALPRYLLDPAGRGWSRAAALTAGLALAGLGSLAGRIRLALGFTEPSLTSGLPPRPTEAS